MFYERSDEIKFSLLLIDCMSTVLAFALAFTLRFFLLNPDLSEFKQLELPLYGFFWILLSISQIFVFSLLGLYTPQRFLSFIDEVGSVIGGVLLNIVISFSILYFFRIYEVSRTLPFINGVAVLVLVLAGHTLFRRYVIRKRKKGKDLKKVVIVGGGSSALRITQIIEKNFLFGLKICGFVFEDENFEASEEVIKSRSLGNICDLEQILNVQKPSYVIYAGHDDYQENMQTVLNLCDKNGIQLQIVPSYSELITANGRIENYDGLPIITIRDIPSRSGLNRILKRTFDFVFSLVFILVFSWVYLLIALLIKLTSPGPVFFYQERVGLDNKVFKIFKFRTMKIQKENESATIWTTKNDPRVTKLGSFLRKTSLDEIPQFFNTLIGQMSVVGPRPERPFYVEQFKEKYTYFKRRHAVKAGITGWAQINGLRGDTSIQERVDADIYYIENWSLFFDIKIILLTPFKGIFNSNAY